MSIVDVGIIMIYLLSGVDDNFLTNHVINLEEENFVNLRRA